jgi:branched-chain amino acid transport system substrate-binding protein
VVVILIVVSVAGKKQNESGPIKVGLITPLTGDVQSVGEVVKNITDLAVQEINEKGGIDGRSLEIVYEDDKCDPADSVTAAHKLVEVDKLNIIIGNSCSGSVMSILPVTDKVPALLLSSSATSPDLDGKSKLFNRFVASDSGEGTILARTAIERGWKKVGFIQEKSDYALGIYNAFVQNYPETFGTIINEEYFKETTDFRSLLLKIKAGNPDVLFLDPQSPATAQKLLTTIAQLKWNIPIMANNIIIGSNDIVLTNKTVLEGALGAELTPDLNNSKYLALESKYKSLYGKDVEYKAYAQATYDLVYLLSDGIKQFGSDPEKISAWLRTVKDYDGASGKVSISSEGNRIGGHTLTVVRDGIKSPLK